MRMHFNLILFSISMVCLVHHCHPSTNNNGWVFHFYPTDNGNVCLSCTGLVSTTDCDTVQKCGTHESCYTDMFVNSNGNIRYYVGCRDTEQCGSARRRDQLKRDSGDVEVCSQCCEGRLCNSHLCGHSGYVESRGPLCYNCASPSLQNRLDDCNKIRVCGRDEVCMLHHTTTVSQQGRYETKCEHRQDCNRRLANQLTPIIGRKRVSISVVNGSSCLLQCCDVDLCNDDCSNNLGPGSISALLTTSAHPSTVTTNTPRDSCVSNPCMRGTCVTLHNAYTCQCEPGFYGVNCDKVIDYCIPNPCVNGGTCSNHLETFQCTCSDTFTCHTCDTAVPTNDKCQHCYNGRYVRYNLGYFCYCNDGYTGSSCQRVQNHCYSDPCHHGMCVNHASSYTCKCDTGYAGLTCQYRV